MLLRASFLSSPSNLKGGLKGGGPQVTSTARLELKGSLREATSEHAYTVVYGQISGGGEIILVDDQADVSEGFCWGEVVMNFSRTE